jgi:hypothetical protein
MEPNLGERVARSVTLLLSSGAFDTSSRHLGIISSMTGKIIAALMFLSVLASGCAATPRTSFTEADEDAAAPSGLSPVRYWADAPASAFQGTKRRAMPQKGRPFTYLALSGGGGGGAYGAGVLNGWTESAGGPNSPLFPAYRRAR